MTSKMPKSKKGKLTMAKLADRHALYQKAVQAPEAEIEFFEDRYRSIRGKEPVMLREDFCGTALLSLQWCKANNERRALGVDLCEDTLEWGRINNIEPAGEDIAQRLSIVNANVLDVVEPKADISCACNFSYGVFKTRDALRAYFEQAHKGLKDDGLFIMDMFGGTETIDTLEEDRDVDDEDFTFIWDQDKYNPITHDILCHIHFVFPDGSKMENAFTYDWRLWTIPELTELLLEAGFSKVRIFWDEFEDDDDDDNDYLESTGKFIEVTEIDQQESWVSYIVAEY